MLPNVSVNEFSSSENTEPSRIICQKSNYKLFGGWYLCAVSFYVIVSLKGINQRVKQSSHPEFSQNAGICLHPSAHGWKCPVEALQVVRPCPGSHQFPGLPQPWQLPAAPTQQWELVQGLSFNCSLSRGSLSLWSVSAALLQSPV